MKMPGRVRWGLTALVRVFGLVFCLMDGLQPAWCQPPQPAQPRSVVPIHQQAQRGGILRYSVPLTIAGKSVEAGLDTGSTGLHVFPRAIGGQPASGDGPATHYGYGSGLQLVGPVVSVPLAIGQAQGTAAIQRIEQIGCRDDQPCPARGKDIRHFGLMGGGVEGQGFDAILGVGLATSNPANPLAALGVTRWIVVLPLPGGPAPGELILNPTADEVARYRTVPLIPRAERLAPMQHDSIAGCLAREQPAERVCGAVTLDTGAPGVRVVGKAPLGWSAGTPAALVIGGDSAPFRVDSGPGTRLSWKQQEVPRPRILAGTLPYFSWSVLYDMEAQTIGLAARPCAGQ